MATGVTIHDSVIDEYKLFQLKKTPYKYKIYKIENGVVVPDVSGEASDFETFKAALPPKDCRYCLYDLEFTTKDGRPKDKIVFISWAPDTAPVKAKMIYSGSKDALTKSLTGISAKINATDPSELTLEALSEEARKFA